MKRYQIAVVYNASPGVPAELPEDRASTADLRRMIRLVSRTLRRIGHEVFVLPLAHDLFGFQRRLRRLNPDVVFNLYDDVEHGALYDMRVAAVVRILAKVLEKLLAAMSDRISHRGPRPANQHRRQLRILRSRRLLRFPRAPSQKNGIIRR